MITIIIWFGCVWIPGCVVIFFSDITFSTILDSLFSWYRISWFFWNIGGISNVNCYEYAPKKIFSQLRALSKRNTLDVTILAAVFFSNYFGYLTVFTYECHTFYFLPLTILFANVILCYKLFELPHFHFLLLN